MGGESVVVTIRLTGTVDRSTDPTLVVRPLPLVLPERHRIDIRSDDGTTLIAFDGVIDEPRRLDASSDTDG